MSVAWLPYPPRRPRGSRAPGWADETEAILDQIRDVAENASGATDEAMASFVEDTGSQTRAQLDERYVWTVDGGDELDTLLAALPAWTEGQPVRTVYVKPGSYTRTQAARVPSGTVLSLYGVTFTLVANAGDDVVRNADRVGGNEWIWILGGTLDGNGANQSHLSGANGGESGVSIYNSRHVVVRDVFARNCFRHGFDATTNLYANPDGDDCSDITFVNCTATSFGDDGFTTHFARSVTFTNCTAYNGTGGLVANGASHGFEIDDGSADVMMFGCTSYDNSRGRGFYVKSHSSMPFHARFTLIGCEAYGNNLEGFGIQSEGTGTTALSDVSLVGCWSHHNTGDGLRIWNAANVTVTDFAAEGGRHGIRLIGVLDGDGVPNLRNVTINGFRIRDTTHAGIMADENSQFDGVRITDGVIADVGSEQGAYIGATGITLDGVRIVNPKLAGIRVRTEARNINLRGVEIVGAPFVGISIEGAAQDVTVTNCDLHSPALGNTRPAIEVPAGATVSNVRIENNRARGWARAMYVLGGGTITGGSIRDNDFAGNSTNAISGAVGSTPGVTIRGNLGYVTESSGTTTIPDGSASVTVTHGLGSVVKVAPTVVQATARANEAVWVSARTTTTFTITRAGTTGALAVDWSAEFKH